MRLHLYIRQSLLFILLLQPLGCVPVVSSMKPSHHTSTSCARRPSHTLTGWIEQIEGFCVYFYDKQHLYYVHRDSFSPGIREGDYIQKGFKMPGRTQHYRQQSKRLLSQFFRQKHKRTATRKRPPHTEVIKID